MTSTRKVRSNQKNARASTGPRSAQGKARASQNARQHGLSLSALVDPDHSAAVKAWARSLLGDSKSKELQAIALQIAAAQVDLLRVRQARHFALTRALTDASGADGPISAAEAVAKVASALIALDRYEKRALSRRKFAARIFYATQSGSA
jgi:hypothetical protein